MNTKKLPILSSILCSMVLLSVSAYGATFVVRPDRSLVRVADAIVVGSALTSYAAETANGGIETVTSVSIEEVVKGRLTASAIDVVEPGGEVRGRLSIVAGAPQFAPGRRTLLFLMRTGPNRWSVLDLAVGKFTFADDRIGRKILVRDEDEVVGLDPDLQPHQEPRRKADDFLQFVREETRGVHSQIDYTVPVSELTEPTLAPAAGFRFVPTAESLHPRALVAPYSANSYTMTISGSQGSRWNVFPSAVTFFMGTTQEAGAPGGGATAIQTAFASWNGDTGSNVNYVYGGVDDGTHTQGLHAPDGRNTVLFERDLSAWGAPPFTCSGNSYSGTLGIGGITSASGSNTVGSETFVTTGEADVEMNRGIANCTVLFNNGEFNSGVTHEIGHTLGFRHADQTRNSGAACTTDASLECSSHAIMTAVVTPGINAALQTWDIHAVQAVYPGSTGGGCTIPTVTISASSTSITAGQSVTLSSSTTGGVTGYQWFIGTTGNSTRPVSGGAPDGPTITVSPTTTTSYWLHVTNACGGANSNTVTINVNAAPPPPTRKVKSDLNTDGRSDLVIQNASTSGISVWLMNGTQIGSGGQVAVLAGYTAVATGDVDGDGHADIIVRKASTGEVAVLLMAANGLNYKGFNALASPGTQFQVITTADFNKDGVDDVVLQNTVTGVVSMWLMRNGLISTGYVVATPDPAFKVVASGDLDGDGFPDIVLQNSTTAQVVLWRMVNGTLFDGRVIGSPDGNWHVIAVGDFNGNGKDDVILQNQITKQVAMWDMNGFTLADGHVVGNPVVTWILKGRGDFNGDGTSDLVLQDTSSNLVVIWLMSNGAVSTTGSGQSAAGGYSIMVNR